MLFWGRKEVASFQEVLKIKLRAWMFVRIFSERVPVYPLLDAEVARRQCLQCLTDEMLWRSQKETVNSEHGKQLKIKSILRWSRPHCLQLFASLYKLAVRGWNKPWRHQIFRKKQQQRVRRKFNEKINENYWEIFSAFRSSVTIFFKDNDFIFSKRSELYSSTDFIANFGGILGLFLGKFDLFRNILFWQDFFRSFNFINCRNHLLHGIPQAGRHRTAISSSKPWRRYHNCFGGN